MADINALANALRADAARKGEIQGLTEQLAVAQKRANTGTPQANSMLSGIVGNIDRHQGRTDVNDLRPRLDKARQAAAQHAGAQAIYNANVADEKTQYAQGRDVKDDAWREGALKRAIEQKRQERGLSAGDISGNGTSYIHPETGEKVVVFNRQDGPVDSQGNRVNLNGFVPYGQWSSAMTARSKARSGASGIKPTGSERKTANEAKRLQGVVADLAKLRGEMSEKGLAELDSPITQGALSVLPNVGQRWGEEAFYSDPTTRKYMSRLARLESRLSQLASGLAVTGFEMSDRQKWSPNAPGISDAERAKRLSNINKDLISEVSTFNEYYPSYAIPDPDEFRMTGDAGLDEVPQGVDPAEWEGLNEEERAEYHEFVGG